MEHTNYPLLKRTGITSAMYAWLHARAQLAIASESRYKALQSTISNNESLVNAQLKVSPNAYAPTLKENIKAILKSCPQQPAPNPKYEALAALWNEAQQNVLEEQKQCNMAMKRYAEHSH